MNKINPMVAMVVVAGILLALGAIFFIRNGQDAQQAKETSKRGEDSGKQMMMGSGGAQKVMEERMKGRGRTE